VFPELTGDETRFSDSGVTDSRSCVQQRPIEPPGCCQKLAAE
jgi:hypothetical protein